MLISISQTIDSSRHGAGHRFRGQFQRNLMAGGATVVRHGSYVFGQVSEATQARRVASRSELQVVFTDIMVSGMFSHQGSSKNRFGFGC
jgi:hypothetical protein